MKLTPLSIALIALIFLAGIAHQWSEVGSTPWWRYLAALYLVGLVYEWWTASRARIELQAPEKQQLRLGQDGSVEFILHNAGGRGRVLEYTCKLSEAFEVRDGIRQLQAPPARDTRISFTVMPRILGVYTVRSIPLRIRGNLNLALWPLRRKVETQLNVIPDLHRRGQMSEYTRNAGTAAAHAGTGFELHQLRDYAPGDPMRSISWKASARSQKLVTKVFSEERRPSIILVVDAGRTSLPRIGGMSQFAHYINLAATFASEALAGGEQVGLVAAADTPRVVLPPANGAEGVRRIHTALRNLQPAAVEVDVAAAALEVDRIARNRCLVVYFTDLYSQSLEGNLGRGIALWRRRHQPMLVGIVGEEVADLTDRVSVTERDAYNSLAAVEYQRTLQNNAEAARRRGAQVVIANPGNLEEQVMGEYRRLKMLRRI